MFTGFRTDLGGASDLLNQVSLAAHQLASFNFETTLHFYIFQH